MNRSQNIVRAINSLTKAMQFLVSDLGNIKREINDLKSSSILINKDVYKLAKEEILTEVKGFTYETSSDVQRKISSLSQIIVNYMVSNRTEEKTPDPASERAQASLLL